MTIGNIYLFTSDSGEFEFVRAAPGYKYIRILNACLDLQWLIGIIRNI